jgi:hypothetical protein
MNKRLVLKVQLYYLGRYLFKTNNILKIINLPIVYIEPIYIFGRIVGFSLFDYGLFHNYS